MSRSATSASSPHGRTGVPSRGTADASSHFSLVSSGYADIHRGIGNLIRPGGVAMDRLAENYRGRASVPSGGGTVPAQVTPPGGWGVLRMFAMPREGLVLHVLRSSGERR